MKNKSVLLSLTAMAVLSVATVKSNATVWRVNNTAAYNQWANHQVFNDLQAAIYSPDVNSGDTLYVEASGTSYGDANGVVNLNRPLTLIGTGYFLADNQDLQHNQTSATLGHLYFQSGSSGSKVIGLRIADAFLSSIHFDNVALSNITVTRCYIEAVLEFNNNIYNNIIITQNFINGGINHGFQNQATFTGLIFTNNFVGTGGIFFPGANFNGTVAQNVTTGDLNIQSNIQFYNNIVTGNTITQNNNGASNIHHNIFTVAQPSWLTGGNNFFGTGYNTIFPTGVASSDLKYDPNASTICPQCYQGYPGTVEIGMFGGSDPYKASGIPPIPAIYNLQAPANAPAGGNLQTTISTRSNN
ncbi:MAG: hypothetical protein JSS90_12385 [Bacteroidetes bacterium]|nr:hypothetical protein [Bacteroidota bacterium]